MSHPAAFLNLLAQRARESGIQFSELDLARMGSCYFASLHGGREESVFSTDVYSGCAETEWLAIMKAFIEMIERAAFFNGYKNGQPACQTLGSDGFAAFPIYNCSTEAAASKARQSAFFEAVERFAWSTWWDNPEIDFVADDIAPYVLGEHSSSIAKEIQEKVPGSRLVRVEPRIENFDGRLTIFFLLTKNGGVFSGGAAGSVTTLDLNFVRGLNELYRHFLGYEKMNTNGITPTNFYERRLCYMGSGNAVKPLLQRLDASKINPVRLPSLSIDSPVEHEMDDLVTVHRCRFENAPAFIGGAIERLCL